MKKLSAPCFFHGAVLYIPFLKVYRKSSLSRVFSVEKDHKSGGCGRFA